MGSTHYFQRYSQKENLLTNNTLLLLQHFYKHDANRFEEFLRGLVDDAIDISVGPSFEQQISTGESRVDGQIRQKSFNLAIEAKPYGNVRASQLKRHLKGFNKNEENLLIVITKDSLSEHEKKEYKAQLNKVLSEVSFCAVTYEDIILGLNESVYDHELSLQEILDDYEEMCQQENVISTEKYTMLVVSTGRSHQENLKYNIYYDPLDRSHNKNFKYLGLYKDKAIRAVGEVQTIVGCDLIDGKLVPTRNESRFSKLPEEQKNSIRGIINEVDRADIGKDHKFFLVDNFYQMDYKKSEAGGVIRSNRYMHLKDEEGFEVEMGGQELADLLDGREWS